MSIDLMQMIKGAASQQIMNKMGGSLGLDSGKTSKAFETGAAAILGGILNKAQSADGAKSILDLAKNTDFSMLDKLGDVLGGTGAGADQYAKMGGGILDSLLGGNKSAMLMTLAKALGLDSNAIGKLLTMIAPIVVGMLGKLVKTQGLDAAGLTTLLGSQKQSIAGFLPNNLMGDLGLKNVLGDVGKTASSMASAANQTARQVANSGSQAGGGLMKVLVPLLLIFGVGFVIWKYVLSGGAGEDLKQAANKAKSGVESISKSATDAATEAVDKVSDAAGTLTSGLPSLDLSALGETGTKMKQGFSDITTGLADLAKTEATEDGAKALVEKINGLTGQIEGFALDKLEGVGKTASATLIGTFLNSLDGLMEKVPAPLRAIVEPALNSLKEKLNPFK